MGKEYLIPCRPRDGEEASQVQMCGIWGIGKQKQKRKRLQENATQKMKMMISRKTWVRSFAETKKRVSAAKHQTGEGGARVQHTFSSSFSHSSLHNLGFSSGGRPAPLASEPPRLKPESTEAPIRLLRPIGVKPSESSELVTVAAWADAEHRKSGLWILSQKYTAWLLDERLASPEPTRTNSPDISVFSRLFLPRISDPFRHNIRWKRIMHKRRSCRRQDSRGNRCAIHMKAAMPTTSAPMGQGNRRPNLPLPPEIFFKKRRKNPMRHALAESYN